MPCMLMLMVLTTQPVPTPRICADLNAARCGGAAALVSPASCHNWMPNKPEPPFQSSLPQTCTLRAVAEQLRWFAGPPIRNGAALGGNVCTASPISGAPRGSCGLQGAVRPSNC